MEFLIKSVKPEQEKIDCITVAIYQSNKLSPSAKILDTASNGYIKNILKQNDITGECAQTLLLHNIPNIKAKRILLVGVGNNKEFSKTNFNKIIKASLKTLNDSGSTKVLCTLIQDYTLPLPKDDLSWKIKQTILIANEISYTFDNYKSKKTQTPYPLKSLAFLIPKSKITAKVKNAIKQCKATSDGMNLAKDLIHTPGNICNPNYLAQQAKKLAKKYSKLSATVLKEKDLKKLKMNALLAVGQESKHESLLITLKYKGTNAKQKPIVLVGKGITFDSGGLSLKPSNSIAGMKYDMSGAASVLGTLLAAAKLKLPINLIGLIPTAENMPGGNAYRPDDIITTMSGTTVEVLNTDAEGRLILCDALTYAQRFNPKVVIDIATLTGACIVALGKINTGLFGNNEALINDLLACGKEINDTCWNLPISSEYKAHLESKFADIANVGGAEAGSITAACFLSHFAKKYHWAHLDIAGTASKDTGRNKFGTGRPVPLLIEYLMSKT